jgi:PIN domain nuclease of toxin-antitoxin system
VARYLIDSHIFLWAIESPEHLSASEHSTLTDTAVDIVVSAASIWELSIKASLGRLAIPGGGKTIPDDHFTKAANLHGIPILPIGPNEAEHVRRLPQVHRDPFDRILIAQALLGDRTVITRDNIFARYPGLQVFVP